MSWILQKKSEFAQIESVNRQLKKAKSPKTLENWTNSLYAFFKFIQINPDEFVKLGKDKIEDLIESYVDCQKERAQRNEINPNGIESLVSPLINFLYPIGLSFLLFI